MERTGENEMTQMEDFHIRTMKNHRTRRLGIESRMNNLPQQRIERDLSPLTMSHEKSSAIFPDFSMIHNATSESHSCQLIVAYSPENLVG
jgi:hypothetical protein